MARQGIKHRTLATLVRRFTAELPTAGKHPRYNYSPNYYIPSYLNSLRPERHKFTLPGLTITYIHFLTRKATAPPVVGNEEYEHINTIKIHG